MQYTGYKRKLLGLLQGLIIMKQQIICLLIYMLKIFDLVDLYFTVNVQNL